MCIFFVRLTQSKNESSKTVNFVQHGCIIHEIIHCEHVRIFQNTFKLRGLQQVVTLILKEGPVYEKNGILTQNGQNTLPPRKQIV